MDAEVQITRRRMQGNRAIMIDNQRNRVGSTDEVINFIRGSLGASDSVDTRVTIFPSCWSAKTNGFAKKGVLTIKN